MVDILKLMLISQTDFNNILASLNCTLTPTSDMYLLTYLFTNLMAYFLIYAFIRAIMTIYYMFFAKTDRKWL